MTLENIIAINKNITKIKELNIEFEFDIAHALSENLIISDKIINEQNVKFTTIIRDYGIFDGYEFVISGSDKLEAYNKKCKELYDEEFDTSELISINESIKKTKINLTTMELLNPILKINK